MIKLQIIGNLGKDAEMKTINGKNYISYSVAHTDKEFTTWIDVMQFTRDENPGILPYLTKGTKVYAEGNPSTSAYATKDGIAKASLTLWAFHVQLLGTKTRTSEEPQQQQYQAPQQSPTDEDSYPF